MDKKLSTLVLAARTAYDALANFADEPELVAAYEAVRDMIDMLDGCDNGEPIVALLSGTLSPAKFCRDLANDEEEMGGDIADDDPESANEFFRLADALRSAADTFDRLGR